MRLLVCSYLAGLARTFEDIPVAGIVSVADIHPFFYFTPAFAAST